ncbi:hypothetical protein, partial [Roseiflexus castenholzii]|uniref:hypothetical protein n=1 Tax=Roseiflexus castenholzii TaxID=120962 RepID=UPI003C79B1DF
PLVVKPVTTKVSTKVTKGREGNALWVLGGEAFVQWTQYELVVGQTTCSCVRWARRNGQRASAGMSWTAAGMSTERSNILSD